MGFLSGLKSFFKSGHRVREWSEIKEPPKWVWKAYFRWERRLPTRPYNMTKHFVGKTFIYRVRHGMGPQGYAPVIGWYKQKKRNKIT